MKSFKDALLPPMFSNEIDYTASIWSAKAFLDEQKERQELRDCYLTLGYPEDEKLDEVIEIIRNQR